MLIKKKIYIQQKDLLIKLQIDKQVDIQIDDYIQRQIDQQIRSEKKLARGISK